MTGTLQCCYLGTEPSLFVAPAITQRPIDFAAAEQELIQLNAILEDTGGATGKLRWWSKVENLLEIQKVETGDSWSNFKPLCVPTSNAKPRSNNHDNPILVWNRHQNAHYDFLVCLDLSLSTSAAAQQELHLTANFFESSTGNQTSCKIQIHAEPLTPLSKVQIILGTTNPIVTVPSTFSISSLCKYKEI